MALPTLTPEQRAAALEKAAQARTARARRWSGQTAAPHRVHSAKWSATTGSDGRPGTDPNTSPHSGTPTAWTAAAKWPQ